MLNSVEHEKSFITSGPGLLLVMPLGMTLLACVLSERWRLSYSRTRRGVMKSKTDRQ